MEKNEAGKKAAARFCKTVDGLKEVGKNLISSTPGIVGDVGNARNEMAHEC